MKAFLCVAVFAALSLVSASCIIQMLWCLALSVICGFILVVVLTWFARSLSQPMCKISPLLQHLSPLTPEQTQLCVTELNTLYDKNGLDVTWNDGMRDCPHTAVLLTGATGFVGQAVLLELLRRIANEVTPCAKTRRIFLLIRPGRAPRPPKTKTADQNAQVASKGLTPFERAAEIRALSMFEGLRDTWDRTVRVVEAGDFKAVKCGISSRAIEQLADAKISHIIHCAADIKFDRPLGQSAAMNISPSLQMQVFAAEWPTCKRVVYVSTAFVNPDCGCAEAPMPEELRDLKTYDPVELYKSMIGNQSLALAAREELGFPNNYTFTKCVAEHLLVCNQTTPLWIVRPAIVGPAWVLPQPGWAGDAPSTLTALCLAFRTRLVRVIPTVDHPLPVVPVDVVATGIVHSMTAPIKHRQAHGNVGMLQVSTLTWDSGGRKFPSVREFLTRALQFWAMTGRISYADFILSHTLIRVGTRAPKLAPFIFNCGPLYLVACMQKIASCFGIQIAPKFKVVEMLKHTNLVTSYAPFTARRYSFASDLNIPLSLDINRYIVSCVQVVEAFLDLEMPFIGKDDHMPKFPTDTPRIWRNLQSKKERSKRHPSKYLMACSVRHPNSEQALQQDSWRLCELVPARPSDLWWALTQPRGNLVVRVMGFLATKVIRATGASTFVDLVSVAAVADELNDIAANGHRRSRRPCIILAPTHRSVLDFILVSYIAFAMPSLGIRIPYVAAASSFKGVGLSFLLRWAHAFWVQRGGGSESKSERDASLAEALGKAKAASEPMPTLEVFLEGTRSRDRRFLRPRTGLLRALLASPGDHDYILVPISIDYERVAEHTSFTAELAGEPSSPLALSSFLKWLWDVFVKQNEQCCIGDIRVSFGRPAYMQNSTRDGTSGVVDVADVAYQVQREHRATLTVTGFHLAEAQCHLHIPASVLLTALQQLGATVVHHRQCRRSPNVDSTVERWCIHNQWLFRFAPMLRATHPKWAEWLLPHTLDQITDDPQLLSSEVQAVLAALCSIFDCANSLASRADAALLREHGAVLATATQIEAQMVVLGCAEGLITCKAHPTGVLGPPITTMAAVFIVESRI